MLALSDQPLITGLGVLNASFTTRYSMSFYHFKIISALAWFSSTAHLSTLSVLQVYLIEHPSIRNWRVAGMLCMLAMLIFVQIVSSSGQDNSLPVQCALRSPYPHAGGAVRNFMDYLSLVWITGFLLINYSDRIIRLYSYDADFNVLDWALKKWKRRTPSSIMVLPTIIFRASRNSEIEAGEACRSMKERNRMAKLALIEGRNRMRYSRVVLWVYTEMGHAFLSEIFTLIFSVAFGVTQIVCARNVNVPGQGLAQNQNSMTFGQILPLLLIALPFLQAGEVYHGKPNPK